MPRPLRSTRDFLRVALALALAACGGGGDGGPTQPTLVLTTINVSLSSPSIALNATTIATASGLDQNGGPIATGVITWSSSNTGVASVSSAGVITGVAAGTANIIATVGAKSGQATVTVQAPTTTPTCATSIGRLNLGETRTLSAADLTGLCIGSGPSANEYVLMAFNNSTSAATTTPFQLDATNTASVTTTPDLIVGAGSLSLSASRAPESNSLETQFREAEFQAFGSLAARRRVSRSPLAAHAARIPSALAVGAIIPFNTNLNGTNTCTIPRIVHPARVVALFPHAAVLIDTLSPPGGYTDAELTSFGAAFDTLVYAIDTLNFGQETDIDENGRVVILFTPGINRLSGPSGGFVGGLFSTRDLFSGAPGDGCEGSNEGEMFYLPVPDPQSTINGSYTKKSTLVDVAVGTLAHEFQHLINSSRRVYVNSATSLEQVWLNEGLSHIAEELLYFHGANQGPGINISVNTVRTSQAAVDAFNLYEIQNYSRYLSYLRATSANSPFSTTDGFEMRGGVYTLLRYAQDMKGGSDVATWHALANATTNGRTNFNAVFGDLTTTTRDWAMANFLDDLNLPTPAKYQHPSWNYRSVFTGLGVATLPLATSQLAAGTPLQLALVGGGAAYARFRVNPNLAAQIVGSASGQPVPSNIDFILVRTQ